MNEIFSEYHQKIIDWQASFRKLPIAGVYAGFLFTLIGILGFMAGLLFFSDKPVAYWILLIMGIASGFWFVIMYKKLSKMKRILADLEIIKDFAVFKTILEKVLSIRKDHEIKDKTNAINELFIEKNLNSKEIHLEINRIAIEIHRIQARES